MSVVLHFQSSGSIPGDGSPVRMVGNSMTIGRGAGNDLVLPDPDRTISARHCAIEDQNGNVVVIDLSTNGTFLNYGKIPLGRVPTPLNDGDILTIGPYEIAVELTSSRATQAGPETLDPVGLDPIAPVGARPDDDLAGLLDAPPPGKDFVDDLLGVDQPPKGPGSISRPELGEDGLLPPLGDEDFGDPLAPATDPDADLGASQSVHSPSVLDQMPLPRTSGEAIPDDWDLDLNVGPPADTPAPTPGISPVPDDPFVELPSEADLDDLGGAAFIPEDLDIADPLAEGGSQGGTRTVPEEYLAAPAVDSSAHGAAREAPVRAFEAAATGPSPAGAAERAALSTLLEAAGVGDMKVSDDEVAEMATRLGNVLRIVIHGMREILMTRTSIKSEFRIDQTRISASGNNPLKFSVTPEQAVEVMVSPQKRGYLSAEAAAEQALRDIKAHEVATMTGMEAALRGVLKRLSPEALESQITTAGGLGGMLKGRKARYWETYERIYADVADAAENDFHELFSREFARAYQEQLDKLKDET